MTSSPILVEYSDRGEGFTLWQPAERDDAYRAVERAADALLRTVIAQPQVNTEPHPVWGLLAVDVKDRGPHWCFVVQGRGGRAFGAAGTCQFVFADAAQWLPGDLWVWCTARTAGGRFVPNSEPQAPPWLADVPDGSALRSRVLRALVGGHARIPLGDDPAGAATALGELLLLLPPDVVARYLWTTCLLSKPYTAQQPTAGGVWPADLRRDHTKPAGDVDAWFSTPRALDGAPVITMTALRWRALDWIAANAGTEGFTFRVGRDATGMAGLLDTAALLLPIDVAEVGSLLNDPTSHERLRTAGEAIKQWAAKHPTKARAHVLQRTGDQMIQGKLLAGLINTTSGVELCAPPGPEPEPGWHARLAEALVASTEPGGPTMRKVVDRLRRAGGPLERDDALARVGAWLTALGFTRAAHPDLFPLSVDHIAERLRADGRLSDHDRAQLLGLEGDPLETLVALAPAAGPDGAADLVGVLLDRQPHGADGPGLGRLTAALVSAGPRPASQFRAVLDTVEDRTPVLCAEVVRSGLDALTAWPDMDLTTADERRCAAVLADEKDLDDGIRLLLRRLSTPPVAPERRGPPPPARTTGGDAGAARPSPQRHRRADRPRSPASTEPPHRAFDAGDGRAALRRYDRGGERREPFLSRGAIVALAVFCVITAAVVALMVRGVLTPAGVATPTPTPAPVTADNTGPARHSPPYHSGTAR